MIFPQAVLICTDSFLAWSFGFHNFSRAIKIFTPVSIIKVRGWLSSFLVWRKPILSDQNSKLNGWDPFFYFEQRFLTSITLRFFLLGFDLHLASLFIFSFSLRMNAFILKHSFFSWVHYPCQLQVLIVTPWFWAVFTTFSILDRVEPKCHPAYRLSAMHEFLPCVGFFITWINNVLEEYAALLMISWVKMSRVIKDSSAIAVVDRSNFLNFSKLALFSPNKARECGTLCAKDCSIF